MLRHPRPALTIALGAALVIGTSAAACDDGGSTTETSTSENAGGSTGSAGGAGGEGAGFVGATGTGGSNMEGFDVQPADLQTLAVTIGQQTPTITYEATLNGAPVNAGWSVDQGSIGSVDQGPSSSAVFTPSGTTGGAVKLIAGLNMSTIDRDVFIQLSGEQNGYDPANPAQVAQVPTTVAELTAGGGVGGVGGEGLGPGVTDAATLSALSNPTNDGQAQNLRLIYPYDATVWPRGLLAPNLMWRWALGDADAIRIDLVTTSGSFAWTGTFARPAILALRASPSSAIRSRKMSGRWRPTRREASTS